VSELLTILAERKAGAVTAAKTAATWADASPPSIAARIAIPAFLTYES
jgi:hypothetical protein